MKAVKLWLAVIVLAVIVCAFAGCSSNEGQNIVKAQQNFDQELEKNWDQVVKIVNFLMPELLIVMHLRVMPKRCI